MLGIRIKTVLFARYDFSLTFAVLKLGRGLSSAGSEHLPYKQRVGGSNPSAPTLIIKQLQLVIE